MYDNDFVVNKSYIANRGQIEEQVGDYYYIVQSEHNADIVFITDDERQLNEIEDILCEKYDEQFIEKDISYSRMTKDLQTCLDKLDLEYQEMERRVKQTRKINADDFERIHARYVCPKCNHSEYYDFITDLFYLDPIIGKFSRYDRESFRKHYTFFLPENEVNIIGHVYRCPECGCLMLCTDVEKVDDATFNVSFIEYPCNIAKMKMTNVFTLKKGESN